MMQPNNIFIYINIHIMLIGSVTNNAVSCNYDLANYFYCNANAFFSLETDNNNNYLVNNTTGSCSDTV